MTKIEDQARAKINYALSIGTSREYINTMWELLEMIGMIAPSYESSLPTQQDKVVVPPMIDKYLNVGNKAQKLASLVSNKYTMLDSDESDSELKQWLKEISMNDLLSLYNGYTVEKEQLYYVRLPFNEGNHIKTYYLRKGKVSGDTWFGSSNAEYSGNTARLTEQEIKDHDERYWAFAVPVEEDE